MANLLDAEWRASPTSYPPLLLCEKYCDVYKKTGLAADIKYIFIMFNSFYQQSLHFVRPFLLAFAFVVEYITFERLRDLHLFVL